MNDLKYLLSYNIMCWCIQQGRDRGIGVCGISVYVKQKLNPGVEVIETDNNVNIMIFLILRKEFFISCRLALFFRLKYHGQRQSKH